MPKSTKALRFATTVETDSPEIIKAAVREGFQALMTENNLTESNLISILFTLTPDLKSYNPATALRTELGIKETSMICAQEAYIEGGLEYCIRALIHVEVDSEQSLKHVYQKNAKKLRSDWANLEEL